MPSPELRCLECNRAFADLTANSEVERCADCGKFVVATPTLLTIPSGPMAAAPSRPASETPVADVVAEEDIPTIGKAKQLDDELPLAQPTRAVDRGPQPKMVLPAWAKRDGDEAPPATRPSSGLRPNVPGRPAAATARPRADVASTNDDTPIIEPKKPRIGFALFVAFLFFLAFMAALGVLGYTIVRGLQMKKVITQNDQPILAAKPSTKLG